MTFTEKDLTADPHSLFQRWFDQAAVQSKKIGLDHTACALGTATKRGEPSVRIVLLKSFDEDGFVFFTNYTSRKGRELRDNPRAALCFLWPVGADQLRQVRVEGRIQPVSARESDDYFHSRPRGSQIGAIASAQSRPLGSRKGLEKVVNALERKFQEHQIPRPSHWGGFRLKAQKIEFWQSCPDRLHDRFLYSRKGKSWEWKRLYP